MAKGFVFQSGLPYYLAKYDSNGSKKWEGGMVYGDDLQISPAAAVLSYGQTIFEGTKVFRGKDGKIRFFRVKDNAKRLQRSAAIVGLPIVPENVFFEALNATLKENISLVPDYGEGTLYMRPLEFASAGILGQALPAEATLLTWVSPVGDYFAGKGKDSGLRLRFVGRPRVAATGIGEAKVAANYVGSLVLRNKWVNEGYSDIVFGRSDNITALTESTGANAFILLDDGSVVTPPLDGEILAGITRDSVIQLLKTEFKIPVIERTIELQEIKEKAKEMFFTGTAWTVAPVTVLESENDTITFSKNDLCTELRTRLSNIQFGVENDPHNWTQIFKSK